MFVFSHPFLNKVEKSSVMNDSASVCTGLLKHNKTPAMHYLYSILVNQLHSFKERTKDKARHTSKPRHLYLMGVHRKAITVSCF